MAKNSGFIFYPKDINIQDEKGNTALYYVTQHKENEEFIKFLLKSGADVNIKCENANTPLHMAFL